MKILKIGNHISPVADEFDILVSELLLTYL